MAIENKIKRQIAFSPTTWERLRELSDRMDTPVSTLVNLGIAWWMDYHDLFKMVPELLGAMQNVEEVVGNRVSQIEGGNLEGDST